jgi:hypothetical protein
MPAAHPGGGRGRGANLFLFIEIEPPTTKLEQIVRFF